MHRSTVSQRFGLGGTSRDMHIESRELQRMSATTGMRIGECNVTVNGIETAHSEYVHPVVTILAQSDNAQVLFATEASTFYVISRCELLVCLRKQHCHEPWY